MDVILHYQSYPRFLDVRIGGIGSLDNKRMGLQMAVFGVFDPPNGIG